MCKETGKKKHAVVDTCTALEMSPGVTRCFLIQIWTSSFLPSGLFSVMASFRWVKTYHSLRCSNTSISCFLLNVGPFASIHDELIFFFHAVNGSTKHTAGMLLILSAKLAREGDKRRKNESLKGIAGLGTAMLSSPPHSSFCAYSLAQHEVHLDLQRHIVTWNCLSFKLLRKLWAQMSWQRGSSVMISNTGNLQSIPDCQVMLDPVGRDNCSDWIQMWGS